MTILVPREKHHFGWDHSIEAALYVGAGTEITFDVVDTGGGEITPRSTTADVQKFDLSRFAPLTGPVHVEGAEPGDALKITFLDFKLSGWDWSLLSTRYGILTDEFPDTALRIWHYDPSGREPVMIGNVAKVPLRPFPGIIGLGRAEPGTHKSLPPYRTGGNLDIKDLGVGTELWLPVEVPGAMLSIGDTHAVQGHGELAGTALESPMQVTVKVDLITGADIDGPQFFTESAEETPRSPEARCFATSGISESLREAARKATRQMMAHLERNYGLGREDAYLLCSFCGNLVINQMVNTPVNTVSLYMPMSVFSKS
jgi:formamidase